MNNSLKRKLVAGVVAGLAVAGGGAAVAATQLGSPSDESKAIVDDAAQQLGIQPSKLSAALKKALENRVDAAVKAGEITKEQGEAMKARIATDDFPVIGVGHGEHRGGPGGPHGIDAKLDTAATYLGLTEAELRTQLESGKTLAEIAKGKGKGVDGLVQALVAEAKKRLDEAVTAGRLTPEQQANIVQDLEQRIIDLVNGKVPPRPDFEPGGDHFEPGGDRFGGGRPSFGGADAPPVFQAPAA